MGQFLFLFETQVIVLISVSISKQEDKKIKSESFRRCKFDVNFIGRECDGKERKITFFYYNINSSTNITEIR